MTRFIGVAASRRFRPHKLEKPLLGSACPSANAAAIGELLCFDLKLLEGLFSRFKKPRQSCVTSFCLASQAETPMRPNSEL